MSLQEASSACNGAQLRPERHGAPPPGQAGVASEFTPRSPDDGQIRSGGDSQFFAPSDFQRNMVPYAFGLLRHLKGLPGSLGHFARSSCTALSSRTPSSSADPWPCPPPYPWMATPAPACPSARRRWKKFWTRAFITNGVVMALSFLALGSPRWCPDACRAGRPLSTVQCSMVRRIECFTGSMLRPGIFLRGKLDKLALLHQHIDRVMEAPLGASLPPPSLIGGFEPLQGRTRYRKAEAAFDPLAFLSPFSGAALGTSPPRAGCCSGMGPPHS